MKNTNIRRLFKRICIKDFTYRINRYVQGRAYSKTVGLFYRIRKSNIKELL